MKFQVNHKNDEAWEERAQVRHKITAMGEYRNYF